MQRLSQGVFYDKNSTTFRLWAPKAKTLELQLINEEPFAVPMEEQEGGYWETTLLDLPRDTEYFYVVNEEQPLPDPASFWQPYGVHGPSRVVDHAAFSWTDQNWKGIPLKKAILYELHTATFSPAGTFDGIASKLQYLKDLGITAIELMPVAQFPGERNWGYDGAHPYAVQNSYGGPEKLKALINACHSMGLAVVLDVVYNHLGPEGNYLNVYGHYFTDRYRTPWGAAINFDGAESDAVRQYFIDNALYWLRHYHIDGLRLDAIHAIFDFSAQHILASISEAFQKEAELLGKQAWIIAESDLNDTRIIRPPSQGGYGIDAQWSDDFHHAIHAYQTGNHNGYFADYTRLKDLAKAITNGFVLDGCYSLFRKRRHGNASHDLAGEQFVTCIQNHDQIANACRGQRLRTLLSEEQLQLAAVVLMGAPNPPLLFMGQEWGAKTPFLYFTSHEDPELIENVRRGYREECASFGFHGHFHDPQDPRTFADSKLSWDEVRTHEEMLAFYRMLLGLRKSCAALSNCRKDLTKTFVFEPERVLAIHRSDPLGSEALILANFSGEDQAVELPIDYTSWDLALQTELAQIWIGGGSPQGPGV